ncbi:MAG: type 1 glutamine amidotransferase family protein [Methanoregula sp.]|jgi:putative intracellular protease/amidase
MEKNVYLFVCENLADWEPALATAMISDRYAEIPRKHAYRIVTFGLTKNPVTTFGGLTVLPDTTAEAIDPASAAMVILPGSSIYEKDDPAALVPLVKECVARKIPVAAICGGTLFLAKHGFLDNVRHTSAGPGWLKQHAPEYRGEKLYEPSPCVADDGIITANPLGFVGFANAIIKTLDVFEPVFLEFWLSAVKSGYLDADSVE